MTKFQVLLCVVVASALCSFSFYQKPNHSPLVEITAPANGSSVTPGSIIAYKINVTDKEDGSSKYEEIQQAEVFLKVKYLPSVKHISAYLQKEKQLGKTFTIMTQNNCFTCHAVQQKLTGPSFRDIASKYGATAATYERLSKKIIKGSHGVWSDGQKMPAHPNLKKDAAIAIARLVVQYGRDTNFDLYTGTEGTISINRKQSKTSSSVLLLMASYLDHGIESKNRKEGKGIMKIYLK
ncbi:MAG: c-type cytochrome [Chitinophagaceae bacterium]|nr:c-type cytochrome [Chitinophagaceae bacterium]